MTSTFLSIQGEGPFQGQPAVFVRMAKCQLNCCFCDTFFDEGSEFSINELAFDVFGKIINKYGSSNYHRCGLVLTGGEPSLQVNVIPFLELCQLSNLKFMQIESNGILPFKGLPESVVLVVSPKCSDIGRKYLQPHEESLNRASCLKFVVTADEDSPYHTIPDWAFEWQQEFNRPIYVSPMNMYRPEILQAARKRIDERKKHSLEYRSTIDEVVSGWDDTILDREKNRINHSYAAKYALDHGLFLTLQMQLFASIA